MLDSLVRRHFWLQSCPYDLAVFGLSLLLGIAVCVSLWTLASPPLWTLAALVGVGLVVGILNRPGLLPLTFLVLTSTVIRVKQAPSLSIGLGTLYLTDVVFLLSLAYVTVCLITKRDFRIIRTPLDWPLLVFWGASLISTLIAIVGSSLPWKQSLQEIRVVTSYLIFFVVTNVIRDKRQLALLVRGLILLATIVALVMIVQHFSGQSRIILAGRIEDLAGVARIIPPGQSIIMVAFTAVFATLVLERASALRFFQCGLLAVAIVLTFFRAAWVVTGLTMLIIGLLARGRERKRLILFGVVTTVMVTILSAVVLEQPDSHEAKLVDAASQRLFTLFDSRTFNDPYSSLRWRDFEYSYALPHILSNPFVGLGLGANYRPLTSKDYKDSDGRAFIHNGHIYVLLKSGVFGYMGLLWFMVCALVRGLKYWRQIPDPYMRGIVLAFTLTFLEVSIVSIVEPYVMDSGWTPVIGIIAGINEVVFRQVSREPSAVRQSS